MSDRELIPVDRLLAPKLARLIEARMMLVEIADGRADVAIMKQLGLTPAQLVDLEAELAKHLERLKAVEMPIVPGHRVYAWVGHRRELDTTHNQSREICAARSMAQVARVVGVKGPRELWNLCETGNKQELRVALREPGIVFWKDSNDYSDEAVWHRAVPVAGRNSRASR